MPRSSSGGHSGGRSSQGGSRSQSGKSERGLASANERTKKEVSKKAGDTSRGGRGSSTSSRGGRSSED